MQVQYYLDRKHAVAHASNSASWSVFVVRARAHEGEGEGKGNRNRTAPCGSVREILNASRFARFA